MGIFDPARNSGEKAIIMQPAGRDHVAGCLLHSLAGAKCTCTSRASDVTKQFLLTTLIAIQNFTRCSLNFIANRGCNLYYISAGLLTAIAYTH